MTAFENKNALSATDQILIVLFFGTLWGLCETAGGAVIRSSIPVIRAGLLTGIAMGIMGCLFGITRKPVHLILASLVTAAAMQLAVPILHCSPLCKANSNLAVLLHASILSAPIMYAARKNRLTPKVLGAIGFGSALISSLLFYYAGLGLAPCAYLLSFQASAGLPLFMLREGLLWAAFSSILLPAGFMAGTSVQQHVLRMKDSSPRLLYSGSAVTILLFLFTIMLSISRGH